MMNTERIFTADSREVDSLVNDFRSKVDSVREWPDA